MNTSRRARRGLFSECEIAPTPHGVATGWLSTAEEISSFLDSVGADRDTEGRFLFSWPPGSLGLEVRRGRSAETRQVTVAEDVDYRRQGRWKRLAPGLRRATDASDTLALWPEQSDSTH